MENQNVSFIIPVHWGGETIERCIQSILNQKFKERKEIIVIDDACKDEAIIKASRLATKYKEIKIIKNEKNLGLGASLNKAINNSKYENIVIVMCDYIFEDQDWAQKMVNFINSIQNVAAAETYLLIPKYMLKHYNFLNKLSLLCYFRNRNNIGGTPQVMFKKKAFLEVGGYDTKTFRIAGEDLDLRHKFRKKGYYNISAEKTNTRIIHLHGAHNPSLKELLIHKALPVSGEAQGVLFRRYFFIENKYWNQITVTLLYGGLLIPYFKVISLILLVLMLLYYTLIVAIKLRDTKAILIAPFFKVAKDLFVIIGFWKGFLTGKQTFK